MHAGGGQSAAIMLSMDSQPTAEFTPMQLYQLRYFLAVAEKGSFSKGAWFVGVAQSAVSLQIRRLDESLGAALFARTSRGAEGTPAGPRGAEERRAGDEL